MEKSYLVQMKFSSAMNRYFNVPIKTVLRQNLRGISIREKIVMLPISLKDKLLPTGIPYRIEEIKILY